MDAAVSLYGKDAISMKQRGLVTLPSQSNEAPAQWKKNPSCKLRSCI